MILSRIDTRWGTYNSHAYSNGNCLPLTCTPWGMNAFTLQTTNSNGNWFFNPYEPIYQGIRLTHQPSPWLGDFATLLITPVTGILSRSEIFHRQSSYQVSDAIFRPDLLKIKSNRYALISELVPTCYGGVFKFQSERNENISIVLNAPYTTGYQLIDDCHIRVHIQQPLESTQNLLSFYIELEFDSPIVNMAQLIENTVNNGNNFIGDDIHVRIDLSSYKVAMKCATSYINEQQVSLNLSRIHDFEETQIETIRLWEQLLSRVELEHNEPFFYHCLYRTLIFPQTFHEVDVNEQCVHMDVQSGTVKSGKFFTNNGYWDTFRTTYPLYSILYPDIYPDFLEGILNHYKNTGFLPKWLSPDERGIMPGTLVDGVIADAASKNLGRDILPDLLEAMLVTRKTEDKTLRYGRHGAQAYQKLGYLPLEYRESVSHSLDYAYSDWCIGRTAYYLGDETCAQEFEKLSTSYRQLFDQKVGYIRAKDEHGNFRVDFSPIAWGRDYAECSAIQATLGGLHDIDGLIDVMGGVDVFTEYLNNLVTQEPLFECQHYGYEIHEMSEMAQAKLGQLAISNQPSFHIPYLFKYSLQPEKTKQIISESIQTYFNADFKAYPGDEDNGSLSAWYIFSCLGFYPVCPGKPEYVTGELLFDKATLNLPNGKVVLKKGEIHDVYNQDDVIIDKQVRNISHETFTKNSVIQFIK